MGSAGLYSIMPIWLQYVQCAYVSCSTVTCGICDNVLKS